MWMVGITRLGCTSTRIRLAVIIRGVSTVVLNYALQQKHKNIDSRSYSTTQFDRGTMTLSSF